MIDEKKIEEAAETKAIEGGFLEAAPIARIAFSNGFKAGINWLLDNLWHDASEEPKLGKRVLVKINGNLSLFNSGFVVEHIRNFNDCYGIESWLYLDDLLKGGK